MLVVLVRFMEEVRSAVQQYREVEVLPYTEKLEHVIETLEDVNRQQQQHYDRRTKVLIKKLAQEEGRLRDFYIRKCQKKSSARGRSPPGLVPDVVGGPGPATTTSPRGGILKKQISFELDGGPVGDGSTPTQRGTTPAGRGQMNKPDDDKTVDELIADIEERTNTDPKDRGVQADFEGGPGGGAFADEKVNLEEGPHGEMAQAYYQKFVDQSNLTIGPKNLLQNRGDVAEYLKQGYDVLVHDAPWQRDMFGGGGGRGGGDPLANGHPPGTNGALTNGAATNGSLGADVVSPIVLAEGSGRTSRLRPHSGIFAELKTVSARTWYHRLLARKAWTVWRCQSQVGGGFTKNSSKKHARTMNWLCELGQKNRDGINAKTDAVFHPLLFYDDDVRR